MSVSKEHILDEIKRTTAANNGSPFGIKRFEQETGIRYADWHGKYWARWGDAIREAGFIPNELQGGFDEEQMLEKLALLMRTLGKFPVKGDLLLEARRDASFPNEKTFHTHFGGKRSLAAKVVSHFSGREGFEEIVALSRKVAESDAAIRTEWDSKPGVFGFVYLLKFGRYYKIGRTNSVGRREREIAIQLPEKTRLVHQIRTDDPTGIETYWHRRFAEKRKEGEWFELTTEDIQAFKRRKFM